MVDEQDAAYALASWARFDEAVPDELLRALCGAFALIAAADGDVSEQEIERFLQVVRSKSKAFPGLDFERLGASFRDLGQAMLSDPAEGRRHALAEIARVGADPKQRELVIAAAQIAVLADRRVQRVEAEVLSEIRKALEAPGA